MKKITVYSKPDSVQCAMTKRKLTSISAPFVEVNVTNDQQAFDEVTRLGYKALPVVVVQTGWSTHHWTGVRPDKLAGLTDYHQPEPLATTITK